MPRPGLRAHDFGKMRADMLAETLSAYRPSCIQLAPSKALPVIPPCPGALNAAMAKDIARAFSARNMGIAVLGCYFNPIHPDLDVRESQLLRFEEHLRLARDFGCAVVGTETGSLNPDCSWHPGTQSQSAFDTLCNSVERLAKVAEESGCIIGLEPVADQHTLSSIEKTELLLKRIDSNAIGIIFDPVNLVPELGLSESCEIFFARAGAAFGDRIVAVHAKDFTMKAGRKSAALPAGSGDLDYRALFRMLKEHAPCAPILLENTSPSTALAAMDFIEMLQKNNS